MGIVVQSVPGSYELPYAVQRMYTASQSQADSAGGVLTSATDLLSQSTTDLTNMPKEGGAGKSGGSSGGSNQPFDAIIAVGALIKGGTMHFEYCGRGQPWPDEGAARYRLSRHL